MSVIPWILVLSLLSEDVDAKASLEVLQQRVETTRITFERKDERPVTAQLVEKPIFRYSDELRQIEDAGIWLWTDRNRPVAAMKVERYKTGRFRTPWLYC